MACLCLWPFPASVHRSRFTVSGLFHGSACTNTLWLGNTELTAAYSIMFLLLCAFAHIFLLGSSVFLAHCLPGKCQFFLQDSALFLLPLEASLIPRCFFLTVGPALIHTFIAILIISPSMRLYVFSGKTLSAHC